MTGLAFYIGCAVGFFLACAWNVLISPMVKSDRKIKEEIEIEEFFEEMEYKCKRYDENYQN